MEAFFTIFASKFGHVVSVTNNIELKFRDAVIWMLDSNDAETRLSHPTLASDLRDLFDSYIAAPSVYFIPGIGTYTLNKQQRAIELLNDRVWSDISRQWINGRWYQICESGDCYWIQMDNELKEDEIVNDMLLCDTQMSMQFWYNQTEVELDKKKAMSVFGYIWNEKLTWDEVKGNPKLTATILQCIDFLDNQPYSVWQIRSERIKDNLNGNALKKKQVGTLRSLL
jgi:hypothetical protein